MNAENQMYERSAEMDRDNLRPLIDLLWNGRWLIAKIASPIILVGLVYAILTPSIYTATGSVQVASLAKGAVAPGADSSLDVLNPSPVLTTAEIGVIQSRMVLGAAADTVRLDIQAKPRYFPLIGRLIARNPSSDIAGTPVAAWPGFGSYAWGGERIAVGKLEVPAAYRDSSMTLVATRQGFDLYQPFKWIRGPYGHKILSGVVGTESVAKIDGAEVRILVKELVARAGTRFTVARLWPLTVHGNMLRATKVAEMPVGSGIISIQYSDWIPNRSAAVVNAIESAYLEQSIRRKSQAATSSLQFLEDQLPEIKQRADEAQAKLNAYQVAQGSVDVQKETELILNQVAALQAQKLGLVQEREKAALRYTAEQPVMRSIDQQIRTLNQNLARLKEKMQQLPASQQEILSLLRDLKVNTDLYTNLLNSAQQLKVSQAGTVDTARIVDYALAPTYKSSPNRALISIASVLFGLMAGIAALFVRRLMVNGVESARVIEGALRLPTLACIPWSRRNNRQTTRLSSRTLVAITDPTDPAAEALRSLRASIQFAAKAARNNVVMLTSPERDDGVTFVAANLAAVLATAGKKVAVVDADIRRPRLHEYFGGKHAPGITEFAASAQTLESVMQTTQLPGLALIAAGAPVASPGDLLVSERFAALIPVLSRHFDHVLVVGAPVLESADAAIVGPLAGSTLVVLSAGRYPLVKIADTIRQLSRVGAPARGVVLTGVASNFKGGSYSQEVGSADAQHWNAA